MVFQRIKSCLKMDKVSSFLKLSRHDLWRDMIEDILTWNAGWARWFSKSTPTLIQNYSLRRGKNQCPVNIHGVWCPSKAVSQQFICPPTPHHPLRVLVLMNSWLAEGSFINWMIVMASLIWQEHSFQLWLPSSSPKCVPERSLGVIKNKEAYTAHSESKIGEFLLYPSLPTPTASEQLATPC